MLTLSTLIAVFLYLIAAILQFKLLKQQTSSSAMIKAIAGAGAIVHTFSVYSVLHQPDGINLGFFIAGSLIGWLVAAVVIISSLRQPIENLFIGVLPMAALTAALSVWGPNLGVAKIYQGGLIIHILLSILSYSIFTVATFQAFLLSKQDLALKQHHTRGLVASLPPLQTMERLLFEMIWIGMILLTASLVTGFIFLDDLFSQHLVHKTILSIIAWILYAILLWGRSMRGWRSHRAVRWTVSGFFILMLSFFGSKLVLDIIDF
ncbi:cytochrome C assembly family protein [Neptunomonas japonica]|uniref:cytochrome C assembly family protein n=1 Tax=Neptunomonas japonica TaxID=417574 RepID=UPI0003FCCB66|nr:cytochrome c biogenesis protein CcsA [Neptunomonas japonica]